MSAAPFEKMMWAKQIIRDAKSTSSRRQTRLRYTQKCIVHPIAPTEVMRIGESPVNSRDI